MNSNKLVEIHPDALVALNEMFHSEHKDIEKYLNAEVVETNMSEGCWMIPVVDIKPGKPTTPSPEESEGAFLLNDAGAVTLEYTKVPANTVVIRYLLDYDVATFAAKSKNAFRSIIGPITRDMIEELREIKGFQEFGTSYGGYYGTFVRPGSENLVFKDTESGSGVEIRLVSNSSKLSKERL